MSNFTIYDGSEQPEPAPSRLMEVGTSIRFFIKNGTLRSAMHIPVSFC